MTLDSSIARQPADFGHGAAKTCFRRNPELDDPGFFTRKKDPFEERRKRRAEEWASGKSHPDEPDYPELPECLRRT